MIGLKRHGFAFETRKDLTRAFKWVYRSGLHLSEALDLIEKRSNPPPISNIGSTSAAIPVEDFSVCKELIKNNLKKIFPNLKRLLEGV